MVVSVEEEPNTQREYFTEKRGGFDEGILL